MVFDTIGIFTDAHRTDADSTDRRFRFHLSGPRFYSESEADIEAACTAFNTDCDAVVELGDFIDIHSDNSLSEGNTNTHDTGAEGEVILAAAEADFATFTGPYYHVLGNWEMYDYDFDIPANWFKYIRNGTRSPETLTELSATTYNDVDGNPKAARYYAFELPNGAIGIVLDTTGKTADGDEHYANEDTTKSTAGGNYVPATQRTWLAATLAAHEDVPILIFTHYWLYPEITGYYNCGNDDTVRGLLETHNSNMISGSKAGRVVAVFSGHHHPGTEGWWKDNVDPEIYAELDAANQVFGIELNNIKYFNLRGLICGWGSDSGGSTNNGSGGEATPANSYYKVKVGEFVKDVFDVKVTGYGANPVGESYETNYFVG